MPQTTETPGMKIVLVALMAVMNVLLIIAMSMLNDVRTQNQDLGARMNKIEIQMATDYVRRADLRDIISGVVDATKSTQTQN